jgi:hypothetical protein
MPLAATAANPLAYPVTFGAQLRADQIEADAWISVTQKESRLQQVRLRAPADRYHDFSGDGEIRRQGDRLLWTPPAEGGRLNYRVTVNHRRNKNGLDAFVGKDFALLRAEDLFPPAAISQMDGAESISRMELRLPRDWQLVTALQPDDAGGWMVRNPQRKFDRPTGWLAAGDLGIRRDRIAGIQVAVAGPKGQGVRRLSMLALLRWTLPDVVALMPGPPPERLVLVSAGDPLWRGGLSGPASLYIHAERPLLSEDGSSTLLHELLHVLLPIATAPDHDWIDEGLAEYLTLRILRDTDSISGRRFNKSMTNARRKGGQRSLVGNSSSGSRTARAVALLHDLDREMLAASGGSQGLPELATLLAQDPGPIDLERLGEQVRILAGEGEYPSLDSAARR